MGEDFPLVYHIVISIAQGCKFLIKSKIYCVQTLSTSFMIEALTKYKHFPTGATAPTWLVRGGRGELVKRLLKREGTYPKRMTTKDGRKRLLPATKYGHHGVWL